MQTNKKAQKESMFVLFAPKADHILWADEQNIGSVPDLSSMPSVIAWIRGSHLIQFNLLMYGLGQIWFLMETTSNTGVPQETNYCT